MYKRYVDDSHARFETVQQSHSFLNILNKQTNQLNTQYKKRPVRKTKRFRRYHHNH